MRILIAEDEKDIAEEVAACLRGAGYVTDIVGDGETAWFKGETEDYDGIVVDLGLPRLDGLSVVRNLRQAGCRSAIVVLTARGAWMERVAGIDAGADDYLPKPFHAEELIARLGAVLRRSQGHTTPMIEIGGLRLDTRAMSLSRAGRPIALTPLEYRALRYLAHNRGRVVSQFELCEHVWAGSQEPGSNTLEVLIARLRKKIGSDVIRTQRGHGYVIAA
ncbi:response regulator transcription factor [Pinisolibacter sp.]|uniref:response regulator transcription factor n=1 Tax=Pinisolibacter sp. TaxID=2172024 RepID=UPI002FDC94B2